MIRTFSDANAECIFAGGRSRRLPPDIHHNARRKLRQLDAAERLQDMVKPLGNRFEELKGNRKGTYSVRINDQWRITFRWIDGAAEDVRIEDYH